MDPLRFLPAVLLVLTVPVAAAPPSGPEGAGERCEAAVAETVKHIRGDDARSVQFTAARRSVAPPVADETDVKGEGTYRGASGRTRDFAYSCAYNVKTGNTSGVVFRDLRQGAEPSPEKPWQPDLATLSPEACETAIARSLKVKNPRVGRIAFGSDSRKLRPAAHGRTSMEGQGSVERAAGMNLEAFTYRCEFEPSGRIVAASTTP
jgi:hypothetical protein